MLNLGELNFVLFQRKGFHSLCVFLYYKAWLCKWILRQRLGMTKFQYCKTFVILSLAKGEISIQNKLV